MLGTDPTSTRPADARAVSWGQGVTVILRRLFLENGVLKLTSLLLAILIWFSAASLQPRDLTLINVPLQVINTSTNTVVTGVAYKVVDLRVRGPLKRISHISPATVSLKLDVSLLGPGTHSVWIDPGKISLPEGVEALRSDPVSVPVTIEALHSTPTPKPDSRPGEIIHR